MGAAPTTAAWTPARLQRVAFVVAPAFLASVLSAGATLPDPVVELKSRTFDAFVKGEKRVLVQFFQSSCPHCKRYAPEYARAARMVEEQGLATRLAKVDGPKANDLMIRFNVTMVPELAYFIKGQRVETPRTLTSAAKIFTWLQVRELSSLAELPDDAAVESFFRSTHSGTFSVVAHVEKQSSRSKTIAKVVEKGMLANFSKTIRSGVIWRELAGLSGEASCEGHDLNKSQCERKGCCHFDAHARQCLSNVGTKPCARESAQSVCEGHGLPRWECGRRGCCHWAEDVDECMSSVNDDPCSSAPEYRQTHSLVMRRAGFDGPELLEYQGDWSVAGIANWAKAATYPDVGREYTSDRYGPDAMEALGWTGSVVVLLDDHAAEEGDEEPLRPRLLPELVALAAAEPKWRCTTAEISNLTPQDFNALGVPKGWAPVVSVLWGSRKYLLHREADVTKSGGIADFLAHVKAGRVRPVYKSATPPHVELDDDAVTEVVGSTFESIALSPAKDVFVNFYDKKCGQCQKLAPIWNELGRAVNASDWRSRGVVIARMDGIENESEEDLKSSGFPRLVLFPAVSADKKIKLKRVYKGPYELDPLLDFVFDAARNLQGVADAGVGAGSKGKKYNMVERELERRRQEGAREL